jgi:hypothetical protein
VNPTLSRNCDEKILSESTLDSQSSQLKVPPKIATTATWNKLSLWQTATRAIAASNWCIVLIAQLMGKHGLLSWTILWGIFVKNVAWAIALSVFHSFMLSAIALKLIKQVIRR